MKTKLVLTIEVEETLDLTEPLYSKLIKEGQVKVSDMFNPDQVILVESVSELSAVRGENQQSIYELTGGFQPKELKPTKISCKMMSRF